MVPVEVGVPVKEVVVIAVGVIALGVPVKKPVKKAR
jgi:hypothetical protein